MDKISNKILIAVDIGGTLTKVGFYCHKQIIGSLLGTQKQILQMSFNFKNHASHLIFYLTYFQNFEYFWSFLLNNVLRMEHQINVISTGGGAFKQKSRFQELQNSQKISTFKMNLNQFEVILNTIQLFTQQEVKCILFRKSSSHETLITHDQEGKLIPLQYSLKLPLMLANIGSGMSILKFQLKQNKVVFERVGGSALGGGFLFGLQKLCDPQFKFQTLQVFSEQKTEKNLQRQIMEAFVQNIFQIINLYSDIYKINDILITGGLVKSSTIKRQLVRKLLQTQKDSQTSKQNIKRIYFTQFDGYMGVVGILFKQHPSQTNIQKTGNT